jgi:hypothetical protein
MAAEGGTRDLIKIPAHGSKGFYQRPQAALFRGLFLSAEKASLTVPRCPRKIPG